MILRRLCYYCPSRTFRASNPRPQETLNIPPRSHGNPPQTPDPLVESICTVLSPKTPWNNATESVLKPLCGCLSPLQAMSVITRLKNPELGFEFFKFSKSHVGLQYPAKTYIFLLTALGNIGLFEAAKELLEDMKNSGYFPPCSIFMNLVTSCGRAGNIDEALELFCKAGHFNLKPSVLYYNSVLNILVGRNASVDKIIGFFRHYLCRNVCPDSISFNIVMKGLCNAGNVDEAFKVLKEMEGSGCDPDYVTFNTLINGLCRVSRVEEGFRVLREMRGRTNCRPSVVSYTTVILGYCREGKLDEAVRVLEEMVESGEKPNLVTYNILLDGFCKAANVKRAEGLFGKMVDYDVVSYTTMIDGYCKVGQTGEAIRLMNEMQVKGIVPNVYTYSAMISGFCKENKLGEAVCLLEEMRERGIIGKTFMYNSVLDGISKSGNLDQANQIFEKMRESGCKPNKITYTILIYGHCMKARMNEAIGLFHEMLQVGCEPDNVVVVALVSCLLKAAMHKEAKSIIHSLLAKGFSPDLSSCGSIVDGFFKEGNEQDTIQLTKASLEGKFASLIDSKKDQ